MLLEFKVTNFRSVCEEQVLSLRPEPKHKDVPTNVLTSGKHNALNALALYGPNDSGKSNLLAAISQLDALISNSTKSSSTDQLPYDPFLLRQGWDKKPTEFEITFIVNDNRYRYGLAYNAIEVVSEWLYRKSVGREVSLFEREGDLIETKPGLEAKPAVLVGAIESTRPNSLFLSWCDSYNVTEVKQLRQWFSRLRSVDGLDTHFEGMATAEMLHDSALAKPIQDYLTSLGLQVLGVEVERIQFDEKLLPVNLPKAMRREMLKSLQGATKSVVMATHQVYDVQGRPTTHTRSWEWEDRESAGARKALELSGPIIWTLAYGGVLVIDEIEASLHTQLTQNTVNLFLNPATNTQGAQLLFATHDTNLLTYLDLRRDQICFAEKNAWEGTETYALSDFQYLPLTGTRTQGDTATSSERPDTDKEKRYLEGRYGAIPANADFQRFVAQHTAWPTPVK